MWWVYSKKKWMKMEEFEGLACSNVRVLRTRKSADRALNKCQVGAVLSRRYRYKGQLLWQDWEKVA